MKKSDWLTLSGWILLAAIILLSLLAGLLPLPDKRPSSPDGHPAVAAVVQYTIRNDKKPIVSGETAEIRALYASDLFASSRDHCPVASQAATNRSYPKDIIHSANPLFLSSPPATNEIGAPWAALTGRKPDNYESDPEFRFHSPNQPAHGAKKTPKLSIELQGELKQFSIDPDVFRDIALPPGRKTWSVQAQIRINREGRVEHVLAESTDCEPPVYQEIVKKLYQCLFSNVTQSCEGAIVINYP